MRDKILKTTAKLISKNGVHSTSTRAICAELGITAPTLYYYFSDKSVLLDAVMNHSFEQHINKISIGSQKANPVATLRKAWDAYMDFATEEPELYSVMVNATLKGNIPQLGLKCFQELVETFKSPELKGRLHHSAGKSATIYHSAALGSAIFSIVDTNKNKTLHRETRDAILNTLIRDLN